MSEAHTLDRNAQTALFRPRRLGHANLYVSDYEKAFDFYNQVVGFEEVYRQPDKKASFISNGNTYHDYGLMDIHGDYLAKQPKPGLNHLAFELENEVALVEGYRAALKAGVVFTSTQNHDVAHSAYAKDPDGNVVEFYADVFADWRTARSGVISGKKPVYIPGETDVPKAESYYPVNPPIRKVDASVFRARTVSHAGLVTRNYEEMFDFYTRVAGLTPVVGKRTSPFTLLRGSYGKSDLSLFREGPDLEPGLHHVGMDAWSEADLDRAVAMLPQKGLTLLHDVSHPARRAVTIKDPDGIGLQFYVNRRWEPSVIATIAAKIAPYLL